MGECKCGENEECSNGCTNGQCIGILGIWNSLYKRNISLSVLLITLCNWNKFAGSWSDWGSWDDCDVKYKCSYEGTKERHRRCIPVGDYCPGSTVDTSTCDGKKGEDHSLFGKE